MRPQELVLALSISAALLVYSRARNTVLNSGPSPILTGARPILTGPNPILTGAHSILARPSPILIGPNPILTGARDEHFSVRVIASHLSDPWSVIYGPDHYLWITEEKTYRVSRIDPSSGEKTLILDLTADRHFPRYDSIGEEQTEKPWPEGGLMGMAIHPDLLNGKPWVYLAYIYRFNGRDSPGSGCAPNHGGCFYTTKLVRYTWDRRRRRLLDPVIICDTVPGSSDNNAGRLLIAPVDGRDYLFYGIGDLGAGQFDNAGRPNHAQAKDRYEGKILRFNTEPDNDAGAYDRWIPNDNPFNEPSTIPHPSDPGHRAAGHALHQNAVWTYGHRNPEGLAYAVIGRVGRLYSSEHGPYSDDEINIIEKAKNYGHPLIIGFADGNYDGLAAGVTNYRTLPGQWHTSYPPILSERANRKALGPDYRDPLKTFYPNSHAFLKKLFIHNRATGDEGRWPSEAPSSLAVYTSDAIPGWKNSLLMPSLKSHKLIRLKLSPAGDRIIGDTLGYFPHTGRIRDIAISHDGLRLYLAVDSSAFTSIPSRSELREETYRGCIVEFTYLLPNAASASALKNP
ncbi:MAG TPA: PQQ-dependent sugar dehydrogenase [Puia sp.]|nr:PQQ-dependent sugar dehydrogenase [Puia sp.]